MGLNDVYPMTKTIPTREIIKNCEANSTWLSCSASGPSAFHSQRPSSLYQPVGRYWRAKTKVAIHVTTRSSNAMHTKMRVSIVGSIEDADAMVSILEGWYSMKCSKRPKVWFESQGKIFFDSVGTQEKDWRLYEIGVARRKKRKTSWKTGMLVSLATETITDLS